MRKAKIDKQNVVKQNLNMETIIAVSDVHLGYGDEKKPNTPHCNKSDFNEFLAQVGNEIPCDKLAICGDFLDLWRRDLLGVVLENQDSLNLLQEAVTEKRFKLYFVVGNHDYYIRKFRWNIDPSPNDLFFLKNLRFVDQNDPKLDFSFLHGDEFDPIQIEMFYDALCMSNEASGTFMEDIWQFFRSTASWYNKIKAFLRTGKYEDRQKKSLIPAEERFTSKDLDDVDKRALAFAKEQSTVLIYGHTHVPFLMQNERVLANTGSWVTSRQSQENTNTYIQIKGSEIALLTFSDGKSVNLRKLEVQET
ncbi:MAG: metallophosphoesterase [Candidatus Hodarchaeota archaeon]